MTREELADKMEDLAKGIREGKTLQELCYGHRWSDVEENRVMQLGKNLRIKPDPQYIPFTADDWKAFVADMVSEKECPNLMHVTAWNTSGITLNTTSFYLYEDAMKELIFANSKKPFAKEVQK